MGRRCCVVGCDSKSHHWSGRKLSNGLKYFSFPAWKRHQGSAISVMTKRRRMAWIAPIKRKSVSFDNIPKTMFVCSRHFHKGKPAYEISDCDPDWVPTLHLGYTKTSAESSSADRYKRRLQRHQTTKELGPPSATDPATESPMPVEPSSNATSSPHCKTLTSELDFNRRDFGPTLPSSSLPSSPPAPSPASSPCAFCTKTQFEMDNLREENRKLKKQLAKHKMDEQFLKSSETKVKYYTGLHCFSVFMGILAQILPCLPSRRKLSPFQMLLLTLMRLRLNLPIQNLAYLFDVDCKTISDTFRDTISVMYTHLKPLVHWPERHCLRETMPHQFVEAFGSRVAVIDCFEIGIERASNVKANAQTFSHYKHKHTLKYLIGITPQGAVSFISTGWGGSVSDKELTEDCGILNRLLPGDLVLADRGFDIADSVALVCAEVQAPAFTCGRSQLDAIDMEETRELAHLRVHVERVIGVVCPKYSLLSSTVPVNLVVRCEGEDRVLLDKIVCVCCALTNTCPSVAVKL